MKIRIIGGGWYGSHLALALLEAGHHVALHESAGALFSGASGANTARLHKGFHYPRSHLTRQACQEHTKAFMAKYGFLTRHVPINLYAIAEHESWIDFGTYTHVLREEVEFIKVDKPIEFGLVHVEGAVQCNERHVVVDEARRFFETKLKDVVTYFKPAGALDDPCWDLTIDCTFCALEEETVDRYEPCIMVLLKGPTNKAITIVDGPFPALVPWDEALGFNSLTSASLTPLSKTCRTWREARDYLDHTGESLLRQVALDMIEQMAFYWPSVTEDYQFAGYKTSIRAMPRSKADARLVDVARTGDRSLRVRAGKIDAVFRAEHLVKECLQSLA